MRRVMALFIIIPFLAMSCTSYKRGAGVRLKPGQKPGAEISIHKKDGWKIKGELISVKQNSLLLMERNTGTNMTFDIEEIDKIIIFKKSKVPSVVIGSLAGGALGALIGYKGYKRPASKEFGDLMFSDPGLSALAWGLGGLAVGAAVGYALSPDEVIAISDETKYEMKSLSGKPQRINTLERILKKLRSIARVYDYQ